MDLQEKAKIKIENLGLKKSYVAGKIGVSNTFFSYWLNGKRGMKEEKEIRLKNFLKI